MRDFEVKNEIIYEIKTVYLFIKYTIWGYLNV
jgi:hypothetical protein